MIVVFEAELQQVAAMLQRLPELLLPAWARAPRRAAVDIKTTFCSSFSVLVHCNNMQIFYGHFRF
jgi:hypothetical protein